MGGRDGGCRSADRCVAACPAVTSACALRFPVLQDVARLPDSPNTVTVLFAIVTPSGSSHPSRFTPRLALLLTVPCRPRYLPTPSYALNRVVLSTNCRRPSCLGAPSRQIPRRVAALRGCVPDTESFLRLATFLYTRVLPREFPAPHRTAGRK